MRLLLPNSLLRILLNKRNYNLNKCFIVYLIPTESNRGRVSQPENCIAWHKFIVVLDYYVHRAPCGR